jgi:hypothetical protein
MEEIDAAEAIQNADRLTARARQGGRWYARYLLLYAVASLILAVSFAVIGPRWGAFVLTPIWVCFVVAISIYASRQQTSLRGTTRTHTLMIAAWAVLWLCTLLGSFAFHQAFWWWLLGGVAMAVPPLITRRAVLRQIGAR